MFRLNYMNTIITTNEYYKYDNNLILNFKDNTIFGISQSNEKHKVTFQIFNKSLAYIEDYFSFKFDNIITKEDSFIITLVTNSIMEIVRMLLSLGGIIKVIGDQEIKK